MSEKISMISYVDKIGNLSVNIKIDTRCAVFMDDSGYGKTYMFKLLHNKFANTEMCLLFDYRDAMYPSKQIVTDNILKRLSSHYFMVILDNADLYMNKEIIDVCKSVTDHLLIAYRNVRPGIRFKPCEHYRVNFTDTVLEVVR